jgi:hypothetical protein
MEDGTNDLSGRPLIDVQQMAEAGLRDGATPAHVVRYLTARGVPEATARAVVADAERELVKQAEASAQTSHAESKRCMLVGLVLFVASGSATIASLLWTPADAVLVTFKGATVAGAALFVWGLRTWLRTRGGSRP